MHDALAWVAAELVAHPTAPSRASTLTFLIRQYLAEGNDDVRDALERALASGLIAFEEERDPRERCHWLGAFADASAMVDDVHVAEVVAGGLSGTIDALEQFVRTVYEPGEGAVGASCHEQLRLASAMLVAFELTGRLPYSMLAEELVQTVRLRWWDPEAGAFSGEFAANCLAAQLCARLAALHRDADYAAAAVVAPSAHYQEDAARMLASLAPRYRTHPDVAADYGLALLDWLALSALPN